METKLEPEHMSQLNDIYFNKVVKPSFLNRFKRKSVLISVVLTKQLQDRLIKNFKNYTFDFAQVYNSLHPYAAALDQIGFHKIQRMHGKSAGAKQNMIEIGPNLSNVKSINSYVHLCTKQDNLRDQSRALRKLMCHERHQDYTEEDRRNVLKIRSAIEQNKPNDLICIDGAEKCFHQANIGFCNQVYDLTPKLLFPIFRNHNMFELNLFLNLSYKMTFVNKFCDYDEGYYYEIVEDKSLDNLTKLKIKMGYFDEQGHEDPSHIYIHDGDLLMYFTNQLLKGSEFGYDFDLTIEVQESAGVFKHFRIIKTNKPGSVSYCLPTGCENLVMLPKIANFHKNHYNINSCFKQFGHIKLIDYDKVIFFDKQKFENALGFASSREDEVLTNTKIRQYIRSMQSSILIAHQELQRKWVLSDEEVLEVACWINCLAIRAKMQSRDMTAKMVRQLMLEKDESYATGIKELWNSVKNYFKNHYFFSKFFPIEKLLHGNIFDFSFYINGNRTVSFSTMGHKNSVGCVDPSFDSDPVYKLAIELDVKYHEAKQIINSELVNKIVQPQETKQFIIPKTDFDEIKANYENFIQKATVDQLSLKVLAQKVIPLIPVHDIELQLSRFNLIEGPPGAGKTTKVLEYIKEHPTEKILFVCQTAEQVADVKNKITCSIATFDKALTLLKNDDYKRIFVDEAFMRPLIYYCIMQQNTEADITLLGDPKQINFINFDNLCFESEQLLTSIVPYIRKELLTVTHRCPKDVTQLLCKKFNYNLQTTSKIDKSLKLLDRSKFITTNHPNHKFLTFSQDTKKFFSREYNLNINTVHEVQGKTFDNVCIILNNNDQKLLSSEAHQIVILTRHTKECLLYVDQNQRSIIDFGDSAFENNIEMVNNMVPIDCENFNPEFKASFNEFFLETKAESENDYFCVDQITQVLDKVAPTCDIGDNTIIPTVLNLKEVTDRAKLNININDLNKVYREIKGARLSAKTYTMNTYSCNSFRLLQTYCDRYAKSTIFIKLNPQSIKLAQDIVDNFFNVFFYDPKNTKLDFDKLGYHLYNMMRAMQDKGTINMVDDEWTKTKFKIEAFLKRQNKAKVEEHFSCKQIKAGQGVSNVDKNINAVAGLIFRPLMSSMQDPQNVRPEMIVANGQDDDEYSLLVKNKLSNADLDHTVSYICDISEQDTGYNNFVLFCEILVLTRMGAPKNFIEFYKNAREEYTINAPNVFRMNARTMQTSGQAGTLATNTLNCAMITSYVFKCKGLKCALFKGDDFAAIADSITVDEDRLKALSMVTTQKLKYKRVKIPDFIGYLVTKEGFVPDLYRISMKVLSKIIVDEKDFSEYQLAVSDQLKRGSVSQLMKYYTISANAIKYEQSPDDVKILMEFLLSFKKISYEEYKKIAFADLKEVYLEGEKLTDLFLRSIKDKIVKFDYCSKTLKPTCYILNEHGQFCKKTDDRITTERSLETFNPGSSGVVQAHFELFTGKI